MAYYTIAHKLQGLDNIEGRATGPSGIAAEQLSDAVFDYIYLRGPKPVSYTHLTLPTKA